MWHGRRNTGRRRPSVSALQRVRSSRPHPDVGAVWSLRAMRAVSGQHEHPFRVLCLRRRRTERSHGGHPPRSGVMVATLCCVRHGGTALDVAGGAQMTRGAVPLLTHQRSGLSDGDPARTLAMTARTHRTPRGHIGPLRRVALCGPQLISRCMACEKPSTAALARRQAGIATLTRSYRENLILPKRSVVDAAWRSGIASYSKFASGNPGSGVYSAGCLSRLPVPPSLPSLEP